MTNDAAAAGAVAEGEPKDTGSDMRLAFQFSAGQSGRGRSVRVTRTNGKLHGRFQQSHRLFQRRLGPARFERRSTIIKRPEIMVGRRGEAPLVPPRYFLQTQQGAGPELPTAAWNQRSHHHGCESVRLADAAVVRIASRRGALESGGEVSLFSTCCGRMVTPPPTRPTMLLPARL